jgi:hypothetical protein
LEAGSQPIRHRFWRTLYQPDLHRDLITNRPHTQKYGYVPKRDTFSITYHLSPITYHLSPITYHLSPPLNHFFCAVM